MEIKAYLNDVETSISTGFTIVETYNEELDTATVVIPWIEKTEFHPFDDFKITIDNKVFTFVVGDVSGEEVSYELELYNYTLNLIGETIKLQKIPLPNLSITQPSGSKRKISQYMEIYNELYTNVKYPELVLAMPTDIPTTTTNAPESQWNEPTMYEVYNTLLAPLDSIVTIKDHKIKAIKLTKKGKAIDKSKIFFTSPSKALNDQITEIQVEAQNGVVPNNINVCTAHNITPRVLEDAVVTTDDMKIILDKPIDTINYAHLEVRYNTGIGSETNIFTVPLVEGSLNRIPEQSVYNGLKNTDLLGVVHSLDYKRSNLYYVRGGTEIGGLSYSDKIIFGKDSHIALKNIILAAWEDVHGEGAKFEIEQDLRDIGFYFEYTTTDNVKIKVRKEGKHYAGITDHQTESYVDTDQFAKAEEMTLKRLGNEIREITAQYGSIDECPELGDYITDEKDGKDFILMHRELNVYNDFILFKGTLSKDYVKRDLFYGINARKRNTRIAQGSDALLRTDIDTYICSFGLEEQKHNLFKNLKGANAIQVTYDKTTDIYTINGSGNTSIYFDTIPSGTHTITIHSIGGSISGIDESTTGIGFQFRATEGEGSSGWIHNNSPITFAASTNHFWVHKDASYSNYQIRIQVVEGNQAIPFQLDYKPLEQYLLHGMMLSEVDSTTEPDLRNKTGTLNLQMVTYRTYSEKNGQKNPISDYIKADSAIYKVGHQIIATFKAFDNFSAGMYIADAEQSGGYGQRYAKYVDGNGEFKTIEYQLWGSTDPYYVGHPEYDITSPDTLPYANQLEIRREFPTIGLNNYVAMLPEGRAALMSSKTLYKDNREITSLSLHFEYKTGDEKNVVITDRLVEKSPLLGFKVFKTSCKIYISSTEKYAKGDEEPKGEYTSNITIDYSDYKAWFNGKRPTNLLRNYLQLKVADGTTLDGIVSIGICDANDKLLIGYNKRDTDATINDKVYLNIKKDNL